MTFEKARKPIRLMYTCEILHAGIDAVIEEDIDRIIKEMTNPVKEVENHDSN
jgi:hypothetical protein